MSAASDNFDAAVLAVVDRQGAATYVIRNRLYGRYATTARVLASLKRLERAGAVVRVPSSYIVMITWALKPGGHA